MPVVFLFALCWSGLVLLADCSVGHQCFKQFESGKFPSVTGTITHSELQTHTARSGNIYYDVIINYVYKVDGKTFTGDRLTFSENGPPVPQPTIVSSHPVGSSVQVYYNPNNPDESLLYPGAVTDDWAWVPGLTPFNVVVIGFCTWIGGWLRLRVFNPVAGGVRIIADGTATRVRLPQWEAIWWGLITTGGLAFVCAILGLGPKIIPVIAYPLPSVCLVFLAGIGVYAWRRLKARSGDEDLVIDEASRTLELPPTFQRKGRVTVGFSDIESIWVETIVQSDRKGTSYMYAPTLNVRDHKYKHMARQTLAEWSDQLKADRFTEWLSEKTGISRR
jgi:Protein of unknown function (DUF3592)